MAAPVKLTDKLRVKLEQAAAIDASVEEMAYYCDVSRQTIYNWFKKEPELFDKIERLRQKPILAARQRVVEGVKESYSNAADYLKRKRKKEFGDNTAIEVTMPKPIMNVLRNDSDKEDSISDE